MAMGEGKQGQAGGGEGGGPHACDVGLSPLLTVHGRAGHRRHLWVPPVDHSQLGEGHKANGSEEAAACRGASAGAPRALLWSDPQPPPTHTGTEAGRALPPPHAGTVLRKPVSGCTSCHVVQEIFVRRASHV